jgi:AraC-like DNA-binding protein
MAIKLTLSNGGLLEFQSGLPADYKGPILRGAVALTSRTNIAELIVQELAGEHYSIRFSICKFLRQVTATGNIHARGLYSYFMLKSGLRREIGSIGKLHLRQDQLACFFTGPTACSARFEKDKEYKALDLFYSPKLLEELIHFFPELKDVLGASSATLLAGRTFWALPSMKEITNQILNCPFDEATRQFYFDLKVRELLFQLLQNAYRKDHREYYFTPWETARIHQARTILETHISGKPPTIRALSRQVALNEFKLKAGFRQYFKAGIFEWLMGQKMQRAKELLLTTNKPIKDICALVGYPRTTNFITAFRRRFGMTPGSLRRH